jgi:hypothetical protein
MLFTIAWFVGITNAFNLIDGLDGLAAALRSVRADDDVRRGELQWARRRGDRHDHPRRAQPSASSASTSTRVIFLGDSGSCSRFHARGHRATRLTEVADGDRGGDSDRLVRPAVLDTALAVARRFLRGQPIFSADRAHIHHRLLSLGHSPRRVALLLYSACALLGLSGMLLVNDSAYVAVVLLVIGLGVGLAIQRLRYYEFEELARLVKRGVRQRKVIGRNVRIREASMRVSDLTDLDHVFDALEAMFAQDEFECAEVRLRRSFVGSEAGASTGAEAYRRLDDDVPVWAWHRSNVTLAACWEIRLPFLAPSGERIGSLVLWQDGRAYDVCLADVHAIAHDLRGVVEQKLLALWEPWHDDPDAVVAMAAAGDRRGAGERAVPLPRMSERGTLAIEKDVGAAGKGDAGANRSPRSSSGAFRQRSTPLS